MAAYSGFITGTCSVNSGTKNVTVTLDAGSSAIEEIASGTAIFINDFPPVEAVSGSGTTVTLAENWPHANQTGEAFTTIYTIEGLRDASTYARQAATSSLTLASSFETLLTSTTPTVTIGTAPNELTLTPYQYLVDQFNASIGDIDAIKNGSLAPSKAEFMARNNGVGSGFVHWGKHNPGASFPPVNQGLFAINTAADTLRLGRDLGDAVGISTTPTPFVSVNNSLIDIKGVNFSNETTNEIILPPAPDGLQNIDPTQPDFADLTAAIASGTVNLDNSVINRQDLVLLEVWHEKISDKDVVYPNGLVQYGASTWEGIALQTGNVAQGYSAFYEGDTTTTGRSAVWSALSDANKALFIQDPANNIYSDNGELIQVRARARVIRGLEGSWSSLDMQNSPEFDNASTFEFVTPQLSSTTVPSAFTTSGTGWKSTNQSSIYPADPFVWTRNETKDEGYAIPICLVTRLNQGGYHPQLNPQGTRAFNNISDIPDGKTWDHQQAKKPINISDCFSFSTDGSTPVNTNTGKIASSFNGREKVDDGRYDAITAGQIKDLRIDASGTHTPVSAHHTLSKRARNGEARGWEKQPRILSQINNASSISTGEAFGVRVLTSSVSNVSGWLGGSQQEASGWLLLDGVKHKVFNARDNGTHTYLYSHTLPASGNTVVGASVYAVFGDYIDAPYSEGLFQNITGTPSEIAATFPSGVMGEWIPVIPDETSKDYKSTKKNLEQYQALLTTDSGATWGNSNVSSENTDNSFNTNQGPAGVRIIPFRAKANFTEEAVVSAIEFLYGDFVTTVSTSSDEGGNSLIQSLSGRVATDSVTGASFTLPFSKYYTGYVGTTSSNRISKTSLLVDDEVISGSATSDGIQWETRVTSQDGLASLIIPYRQIKHNGSSYGAGLTFNYVNNTSNATDDNGQLIQVGTARSLDDMNIIIKENFNV